MIKRPLIATAATCFSVILVGAGTLGTGCKATGVGDPCIPEQEYDVAFSGFDARQVVTESSSFQCQTRLCLVNHFQGRVSCPKGQDKDGAAPPSAQACTVPGTADAVTGPVDAPVTKGKCVASQCADRTADNAVYCSCRCANADGKTDDGANYCTCPDSFACTQLVAATGKGNEGLTGAYCIKAGTAYDPGNSCSAALDSADPRKCL